jgi:hypothetical protein
VSSACRPRSTPSGFAGGIYVPGSDTSTVPRFAALRDLPQFQSLVDAHLGELARQRDAYLSQTVAEASGHDL